MNCSVKQLNGLPNGWTVRVLYRDGSLPTIFTIEELKDIEEQIDLRSDWITISVNRYVPKPPSEPGSPVDAVLQSGLVPIHNLARLRDAFVVIRNQDSQRRKDGMIWPQFAPAPGGVIHCSP